MLLSINLLQEILGLHPQLRPLDKLLQQAEDPKALKEELAAQLRPKIDIYRVAALGYVDDVIDPRETRPLLAHYLRITEGKRVERPYRKREITPV